MTKYKTHQLDEAMEFIQAHSATHGYPPSRREIGDALGIKSPSSVQVLIRRMINEGLIEVAPDVARGISIRGSNMKALREQL